MNEYAIAIAQIVQNLRSLFKNKDRLIGLDDWDNFLGCIIALDGIVADLQMAAQAVEEKPEAEGE